MSFVEEPILQYVEVFESVLDLQPSRITRALETSFSQFPVKSNGHIVGSITERAITKAVIDNAGENLGARVRLEPLKKMVEIALISARDDVMVSEVSYCYWGECS